MSTKRWRGVALVCALLGLPLGCGEVEGELSGEAVEDVGVLGAKADAPGDLTLRPLDGLPAPVTAAGEVRRVIRTAADFRRVFGVDATPWLDFNQEWAVLYDAGPRSSGGYDAFVWRVRLSDSRATVMVTTRLVRPGVGCPVTLALSRPFAVVAFRKPVGTDGRTSRFYKDDRARQCEVAAAGEDCDASRTCQAGLVCRGTPGDGSGHTGKCAPSGRPPGSGVLCRSDATCAAGLFCNRFGGNTPDGECAPVWMRGRYVSSTPAAIPDSPAEGLGQPLVVYGLASVPTRAWLSFDIAHPRRGDLRVTLVNPLGTEVIVHERTPTSRLANLTRSRVAIGVPGDEPANGRWTLKVTDLRQGSVGQLRSWVLELESRWD